MDFKSFMMKGVDDECNFLPGGGLNECDSPQSTKSMNNEAPVVDAEPITDVHPSEFAKNINDSDDALSENDGMTLIGPHQITQKVSPQASKVTGDPSNPLDMDSDPNIHAVLDNTLHRRTRKLMSVLSKARASCEAIQEREAKTDKAYAELERKCNEAFQDLEKNHLEIDTLKHDIGDVVSKVVPHVATELIRSDEMALLVARLIKAVLFHGRCTDFEDVANLKEPFVGIKEITTCKHFRKV
nr:hypothetical protein [Tanacetum cinerariifolium]